MAYTDATSYWFWRALVESAKLDIMTENDKQLVIDNGVITLPGAVRMEKDLEAAGTVYQCQARVLHKESSVTKLFFIAAAYAHNRTDIDAKIGVTRLDPGNIVGVGYGCACARIARTSGGVMVYWRTDPLTLQPGYMFHYSIELEVDTIAGGGGYIVPVLYNAGFGIPEFNFTYLATMAWIDPCVDSDECFCKTGASPI